MESYQVIIKPRLERRLQRYPPHIQRRIRDRLAEISRNPYAPFLEPLKGERRHRFRVGGYRVIVERHTQERLFVVRDIDNRGRIYRRRD